MKVIYFKAPWCSQCKVVEPLIEKLAPGKFTLAKVDVDVDPDKALKYGVISLPTFVITDDSGGYVTSVNTIDKVKDLIGTV